MLKNMKRFLCCVLSLMLSVMILSSTCLANDGKPSLQFERSSYTGSANQTIVVGVYASDPGTSAPMSDVEIEFRLGDSAGGEEYVGKEFTDGNGLATCEVTLGSNFPYTLIAATDETNFQSVNITSGDTPQPTPTKTTPGFSFNCESYKTNETAAVIDGVLSTEKGSGAGISGETINWTATSAKGEVQSGNATTDGDGVFSFTVTTQPGMSYSISAVFNGNTNFNSASTATSLVNTAAEPTGEKITVKLTFAQSKYEGKAGSPVVVGVYATAKDKTPLPGVGITFVVTGADGSVVDLGDAQTAITNEQGLAECNVTVGEALPYTIQAVVLETELNTAAEATVKIQKPASLGSLIWVIVLIGVLIIALIVVLIVVNKNNKKKRATMNKERDDRRYDDRGPDGRYDDRRSDGRYDGGRSEDRYDDRRPDDRYDGRNDARYDDRYNGGRNDARYDDRRSDDRRYDDRRPDGRYDDRRNDDKVDDRTRML